MIDVACASLADWFLETIGLDDNTGLLGRWFALLLIGLVLFSVLAYLIDEVRRRLPGYRAGFETRSSARNMRIADLAAQIDQAQSLGSANESWLRDVENELKIIWSEHIEEHQAKDAEARDALAQCFPYLRLVMLYQRKAKALRTGNQQDLSEIDEELRAFKPDR